VTPLHLLESGRPRVIYRRVEEMGRYVPGLAATREFLTVPVSHDFMQMPPYTFPRWIHPKIRAHATSQHNASLEEYVLASHSRRFSEFNVLGAYAYAYQRGAFAWVEPPGPAATRTAGVANTVVAGVASVSTATSMSGRSNALLQVARRR
jgi:hypothetical protein